MDNEMSSHMLDSSFSGSQHRIPSYVSISRAISGYADYNKYSSELKRDSSLLGNFLLASRVSPNDAQLTKQTAPLVDDQVDNFCSLPYQPTHDKICLSDPSKSFLQKKIESLYGESFAEDWKKSRFKASSPRPNSSAEKTRSPSCPPTRIANEDVNSLIKPFHKINSLDISSVSCDLTKSKNASSGSLHLSQSSSVAPDLDSSRNQDGHWFLKQLNRCTNELQGHIERYEKILSFSEPIPDEVVGRIRTTIGKANLLINKKLNQFEQLCRDSIIQSEDQEFKINSDDLRGFWDMVTIQVEEVNNAFEMLDKLQFNNWQLLDEEIVHIVSKKAPNPKHNINSPRSHSNQSSPKNSPKTASPNGLERENERKTRLMEIKRKGKLKARDNAEEEITIYMPTADLDLDK